jgi:transketolase
MNYQQIKKSKERCVKFRKRLLNISQKVSALHVGGSFSVVEILDTIYNILKNTNDKIILSKGHCGIIQYIILEHLKIIKKKTLDLYCQPNGTIGVHPEVFTKGIEASTGSLGHGLGIAAGMAIAKKKSKIFVVMSDGELMEGSIWENILTISSRSLNNLILIIDNNDLQSATRATDTHPTLYPITKKFRSFGWDSKSCNGHSSKEIFLKIKSRDKNKPFALIARTIKGYPISFMKNVPMWHYRSPNNEEYLKAIKELK